MKPKNTTLLEKFGFKDTDLVKPKHDEIMAKLLNPDELIKVIKKTYKIKTSIYRCCKNYNNNPKNIINCNKCQEIKLKDKCFPDKFISGKYEDSGHLPYDLDINNIKSNYYIDKEGKKTNQSGDYYNEKGEVINYPYENNSKYISNKKIKNKSQSDLCEENKEKIKTHCFINQFNLNDKDCPFFSENWEVLIDNCPNKSQFTINYKECQDIINNDLETLIKMHLLKIEPEYVVKTGRDFIIGYIDIKAVFSDDNDLNEGRIVYPKINNFKSVGEDSDYTCMEIPFYFEIKTDLVSLGETLRQINTYKEFCPGTYILITPKTKFKDIFEQNGVLVYELED